MSHDPPAERLVGARVPRREDRRLLAGRGTYVDDLHVPGLLHAAIVRSPVAHGRVIGLDTSRVPRSGPSAPALVLGPGELRERSGPVRVLWHLPGQFQHERPLVPDTTRFVGEALGVVVAADRYVAEDVVDAIEVEVDPFDVVVDPFAALAPGAPQLYPEAGTNVMATWDTGHEPEHVAAVLADADHVVRARLRVGRLSVAPLETRGILVVPDPAKGSVAIWTSTQAPHAVRDYVADVTGLPQHKIRVVAPDVGGGFGGKDHIYEDELCVVLAALELGRPVKWVEDRRESFWATNQARDEVHDVAVAIDADGTLRGLTVDAVRNGGAWLSMFGGGPLFTATGVVPGPYRWDAVRCTGTVVATNTPPLGAYRGFGQAQACYVRERAIDLAAGAVGLDPVEVRLANLVRPDEQPWVMATLPAPFDGGDYPAALRRVRELADAWESPPDDGRARGVGYSVLVHMAGVGPSAGNLAIGLDVGGWERAVVRMEPDGTVRCQVGTTPQGQGHETTFPQLVADALGVDVDDVELQHSDTDHTPYSAYGTAASRSIAVGGGAVVEACSDLADQVRVVAADLLGSHPEKVDLGGGRATVRDTDRSVSLREVATRAWQGWHMPRGTRPGLVAEATYDPENFTFSYSAHACRAAVDRDTGAVQIERYAVVQDCGVMVNPTIVEGQVHGGIAQGLGAALFEEAATDEHGRPVTDTFRTYLVPAQDTVPRIEVEHVTTPSPFTPGGMKGMGEGSTNAAYACVPNAVAAALPDAAERLTATPLLPSRVWEAIHGAGDEGDAGDPASR